MSLSIESFVTHHIGWVIPEVVLRDAVFGLLMNRLREELKGADLEELLDEGDNLEVARCRLQAIATRMVLPHVVGEVYDELGRHVEIPFSFKSAVEG